MTNDRRQAVEQIRQLPPDHIRALCEENFLLAADVLTFNWIEGNERADWDGKPFEWFPVPRHFEDMWGRIRARPANMFLAARKHTKTTFVQALMIWRSEYTPGHAALYWANTEDQVKDRMREFEEIVKANPWLQYVHAEGALKSKHFENGARIDTTWVTGAYEGGHVDLQIGDDPMKELGDISDEDIEAWYGRVIVPTLNPGDTMQAVIGTRKRPNDLYELLRRKHETEDFDADIPGYNLVEYPAIREVWQNEYDRAGDLAPGELYREVHAPELADALELGTDTLTILWPEARPPEWLAQQLGMQGRSYFSREFCMVYREAEDSVVRRPWIERCSVGWQPPNHFDDPVSIDAHPAPVTRDDFERVVVGIDPAGKGRDRFAFVTVGEFRHEDLPDHVGRSDAVIRHVLNVFQQQDLPPSEFRDKLENLYTRYRPDAFALESNLNQRWVADDEEIPAHVRQRIEPITTTRSKHSWKEGVPRIGSEIEAGKYRFYTAGADNRTDELITALTAVQRKDGELVGHTPDLVMALFMTQEYLGVNEGFGASTRTNLGDREKDPGREADEREKKRALKESAVGRSILGTYNQRRR